MRGRGIDWDHEIGVALPASYGSSAKSYPVLWAMDGAMEVALPVIEAAGKALPEMIVVSVGPPRDAMSQFQQRRDWDFSPTPGRKIAGYAFSGPGSDLFQDWAVRYDARKRAKGEPEQILGGAPIFLDFLIDELRPALSAKYRMSDDMILWGHSGGGMFCVFAALKRPAGFRDYICGSPSINASNFAIFELENRLAKKGRDLPIGLFLGAGEVEALEGNGISEWGVVSSTLRLAEILSIRHYPSLRLGLRILPGKTHGAAWPALLDAGLRWRTAVGASRRSDR
jgi:predicted alpha/beta superfamily hydrolase